jgi:hypothetical protein
MIFNLDTPLFQGISEESSVFKFLDLRDRALIGINGETDFISGLYILQERDRLTV